MNNVDDTDLNIENYSLEDILRLFRIPVNFTKEELKNAKRIVLMTHPDKSQKPQEVFLFFCAAYKILHQVYTFRARSDGTCATRTEYNAQDIEDSLIVSPNVVKQFTKAKNFNSKFNKLWEKHKVEVYGDEEGYGMWMKEENDETNTLSRSMDEVNNKVRERKEHLRALVVKNDISASGSLGAYGHSSLVRENPGCFEAPVFGGLQYDDVRRAYTESVVPVTEEDYVAHKKFSNIDELQRFRGQDFAENFNSSNHENKLREITLNDDLAGARRAYELAKQDEQLRSVRAGWSSSMLRLKWN